VPDWTPLVKERLGTLGLASGREEEILAELAAHLDDVYEEWIGRGVSAEEAVRLTLKEVPDWAGLRREIHHAEHAEGDMNQRTKSLWLPGLLTSLLGMGLLFVMQWIGLVPYSIKPGRYVPIVIYWQWYILLPVAGAVGAYCSRAAGGNIRGRIVAGLFPATVLGAAMGLAFLVALFVDRQVPLSLKFPAFVIYLLGWSVVPGLALLLGVLPFLQQPKARARA